MQPIRILLVEDNEDDALLVMRAVRAGGFAPDYTRVETPQAMRNALVNESWDIVLSDFSLPHFSGPAALAVLKECKLDIPFIIVSGTVGEEAAVAALKAGAHDFLSKNNLNRLQPAISRELREAAGRRERRIAEAKLRQSEEALAAVFTSSPLPILTIDIRGNLTAMNLAAESAFRVNAADAVGQRPSFIEMSSDAEDWSARVLRGGTVERCNVTGRKKNGDGMMMLLSASPLHGQAGVVTGAVAIVTDVSEQRALEEQLRQSQKMEAIGQLAGGIAHDFNNILTAIQGYATLLQDEVAADSINRADLDGILDAAARAASFTRQLLAFSRKQVTQPESLNPNELVSGMLSMLGRVIGKEYHLDFEPGEVQTVFVDRGQLGQVIMNLVVNARDAMPSGGTIRLRTSRQLTRPDRPLPHEKNGSEGPYVGFHIRDEGQGIAPEDLDRVFEPFFTTKDAAKGTGLGLSTVYGIVAQHGGTISIDTAIGRGTEFNFFLPERNTATRAAHVEAPAPLPPVSSGRILVVEDDPAIRNLLQRALIRAGFDVAVAENADDAVQMMRVNPSIDLLVTDLMLPGMTGMDLIRTLHAEGHTNTKTILISGYTANDLALPTDIMFVEKPFTPDALLVAVQKVLGAGPAIPA